jgi:hypothetical protein
VRIAARFSLNDLAIGPKIGKLASRHSERDECHHVIEIHGQFPRDRFGLMYESPTIGQ